jgi:hypothetical protein
MKIIYSHFPVFVLMFFLSGCVVESAASYGWYNDVYVPRHGHWYFYQDNWVWNGPVGVVRTTRPVWRPRVKKVIPPPRHHHHKVVHKPVVVRPVKKVVHKPVVVRPVKKVVHKPVMNVNSRPNHTPVKPAVRPSAKPNGGFYPQVAPNAGRNSGKPGRGR